MSVLIKYKLKDANIQDLVNKWINLGSSKTIEDYVREWERLESLSLKINYDKYKNKIEK